MLFNSFTSNFIMREIIQKRGRPHVLAGSGDLSPVGPDSGH